MLFFIKSSILSKFKSISPSSTHKTPHPISTPTKLGTILSFIVIVVPITHPAPL